MKLLNGTLGLCVAAMLALGGCASKKETFSMTEVETRHSSAMSAASDAKRTAQEALTLAREAKQAADDARTQAIAANERADRTFQASLEK